MSNTTFNNSTRSLVLYNNLVKPCMYIFCNSMYENIELQKKDNNTPLFSLNGKTFTAKVVDVYDGDTITVVFKVFNQYLFLMRDQNIVKLENNMYEYRATKKDGIEFIPSNISKKNHKSMLYNSIGLFMFYIITKEVKHNLKEKELDKIYYSKPYFFIKNIMGKEPCLIYL